MRPLTCLFMLCVFASAFWATLADENQKANPLSVSFNEEDGSYSVFLGETKYFVSGPTSLKHGGKWYTNPVVGNDQPLKFLNTHKYQKSDHFGSFTELAIEAQAGDKNIQLSILIYDDLPMIMFEQRFPHALNLTSAGSQMEIMNGFPTFNPALGEIPNLMYTTFGFDGLPTIGDIGLDNYQGGGRSGTPLCFNAKDGTTVVLSPAGNYMVSGQSFSQHLNGMWAAGFEGLLEYVPENAVHKTILYAGKGMNETMHGWGEVLMRLGGRGRVPLDADVATKYIGYWTDNGAYYYYVTDENSSNYEETIYNVADYLDSIQVPWQYMQLDSWWYFKGENEGLDRWEPRPEIFPSGMETVQRNIGVPLVLHNRYFAPNTSYAQNFSFAVEKWGALSDDPKFWDYLMAQAASWKTAIYEQDWLDETYQLMHVTRKDFHFARNWLVTMGKAAEKHGLTIQYCMALANYILQTTEIPAVTHVRGSHDYKPGNIQWNIGGSAIFHSSVGVGIFKDNFWTTSEQGGNRYHKVEFKPTLQAIASALSGGPIGYSDKISAVDTKIVGRTCAANGLLLKPTRAGTWIDSMWGFNPPRGSVWSTYNQHRALEVDSHFTLWRWNYVLAVSMEEQYDLTVSELGAEKEQMFVAFHDEEQEKLHLVDSANPLQLRKDQNPCNISDSDDCPFKYWTLSPVFPNGWAFLGENTKFIGVSTQRFADFKINERGFSVHVSGVPGEQISLRAWAPPAKPTTRVDDTDGILQSNAPTVDVMPTQNDLKDTSRIVSLSCRLPTSARTFLICQDTTCRCSS